MNRAQLRHLVERGSRRARALSGFLDKPEWLLSTTLLGTNLAATTMSAVTTFYLGTKFGPKYEYLAILITGPLMLLFGEVLPKTLFQRFADRLALQLVVPLRILSIVLSPLVGALTLIAHGFSHAIGIHTTKKTPVITREELELLIRASERQGSLKDFERKMVDRIFSFSDRPARDVMIPLVDVVSVRDTATIREAEEIMHRSRFSRMPVFSGRVTHMVGWINLYDLLTEKEKTAPIAILLRKVHYVPATLRLDRLLLAMQRAADTLAIVVDEYGGTVGIVTLENVLESLVGQIQDEFDQEKSELTVVGENVWEAAGTLPLHELEKIIGNTQHEEVVATASGWMTQKLGGFPKAGDALTIGACELRVEEMDGPRVARLKITKHAMPDSPDI